MNAKNIESILFDQQDELTALREENFVSRPQEALIDLKSRLAQVVIGVRRSGKSTLCFQALEKAGVRYAYVNFDDERLSSLKVEDLNVVLETLYRIYGSFEYLFFDEIQNVEGWPLFVNRLLRQKLHLLITGSNAKLLSTELASHLTGRHHTIELFPFSFKDWCDAKKIEYDRLTTKNRGLLARAFDEYLRGGGFPELMHERDTRAYINTLVSNIITRDIQQRFNVRHIDELRKMANHILNEVPNTFKLNELMETCDIKSDHTVVKYLSYLRQTYLVSSLSKYSQKSRQRSRDEKFYAIDVAFMDKRENAFVGENLGWRLETIVYLELRRRYPIEQYDIYYVRDKLSEADFVVCEGKRTIGVYQVSYDISSEKTRKREIRGCLAGSRLTSCDNLFLITDQERTDIEVAGKTIKVIPAYEWLLD
ncbi:MAG: ATP-binding protein [Lachnospiraceae bacterium]|nr:ATP-binding protein [Lachnospiraceae bacterium]